MNRIIRERLWEEFAKREKEKGEELTKEEKEEIFGRLWQEFSDERRTRRIEREKLITKIGKKEFLEIKLAKRKLTRKEKTQEKEIDLERKSA